MPSASAQNQSLYALYVVAHSQFAVVDVELIGAEKNVEGHSRKSHRRALGCAWRKSSMPAI